MGNKHSKRKKRNEAKALPEQDMFMPETDEDTDFPEDVFDDPYDRDEEIRPARREDTRSEKSSGGGHSKRKKSSRSKRGKKKRRKKGLLNSFYLTIVLLALIAVFVIVVVNRVKTSERFEEIRSVVCTDHYYEGSSVEGIDISGMTLEEAQTYWNQNIESSYANATVTIDNGTSLKATELGYSSDYPEVLNTVYNSVRKGSIEERYDAILEHKEAAADHEVHRVPYNEELIRAYVDSIAPSIDTLPQDAKLLSFNKETYTFEYQDEIVGAVLDREQLVQDIETALKAGGGSVTMKIDRVQPTITKENVASNYGMIAYAITNASSSSTNRLSNIELALSFINGTELKPGETFSFNKTVGERTKAAGFKKAPAYYANTIRDELGGGICQVSSTVFNAAVKADMKIKERHAHSMTVSYVDPGKDAAVDWGNKDLRFENKSMDSVYICCYLTKDARVRVGIFGKLLPDGDSIILKTKNTEKIDFETEYQVSFDLASGETKVSQEGKKGIKTTTYKVLLDADGNEITSEELFRSKYNPQSRIILYGQ